MSRNEEDSHEKDKLFQHLLQKYKLAEKIIAEKEEKVSYSMNNVFLSISELD